MSLVFIYSRFVLLVCFLDIGPYATDVGLTVKHFSEGYDLPSVVCIKNGLVLELNNLFTKRLGRRITDVAVALSELKKESSAKTKNVTTYIRRLKQREVKIKQNEKKGITQEEHLSNLYEKEFLLVREQKRSSDQSSNSPRRKRYRQEIASQKALNKKIKKQAL